MGSTADEYLLFAEHETRGVSPTYERLSHAVSRDSDLLARLETLPVAKRQPNLFFAVVRLLGGPVDDPAAFRDFVLDRWPAVAAQMLARATQTNEPGRAALILPVLAALPQPLALLEVGASAGLNLYPDKDTYRYNLPRLAAQAPAGATLVVFHSAVLYQVPTEQRERFVELVRTVPGHWVCVEAPDVVPYEGLPPSPYDMAHYVVALDGKPLAWARPHGQAMVWFG